jgi:F-type H+-transporting ATPase subunit delta
MMIASPVAYRYARSLMELARAEGKLEGALEDMDLVASTMRASRDLVVLLKSPVVKADRKGRILHQIFAGKIGTLTASFISILVRKGREALLPQVAHAFTALYRLEQGIVVAEVRSAVPLSEGARKQVLALAAKNNPGKTIELAETVDPELIGGVIIRIGDDQYDGSVARRLQDLRRKFSENPYIPEI